MKNLNAQFVLARELGARMLERNRGKIIFIASVLAFQGGVNVPGYAASKGAIAQLTKALANEWARDGVNVNAVAPGYIEMDSTQALQDDPERYAADRGQDPGRSLGRAGRPGGRDLLFLAPPPGLELRQRRRAARRYGGGRALSGRRSRPRRDRTGQRQGRNRPVALRLADVDHDGLAEAGHRVSVC